MIYVPVVIEILYLYLFSNSTIARGHEPPAPVKLILATAPKEEKTERSTAGLTSFASPDTSRCVRAGDITLYGSQLVAFGERSRRDARDSRATNCTMGRANHARDRCENRNSNSDVRHVLTVRDSSSRSREVECIEFTVFYILTTSIHIFHGNSTRLSRFHLPIILMCKLL